eukprot:TRINITY_DN561_c0_g1_i1.p1 TRINITY_DN561_c0_g1~~TRINITY_DN561_c0_g1_i1.p1  ORF type:complete len:192 (-),score=32.62 TRINITY_DN561_c0_g1_i1:57-632(-)
MVGDRECRARVCWGCRLGTHQQYQHRRYMQDFAPSPTFLPVAVTITVPSHNITFPKVTLRATDCVHDVKRLIVALFEKKGDPVVAFPDTCTFHVKRSTGTALGVDAAVAAVATAAGEDPILTDPRVAMHQYKVTPGSEIVLRGPLQLKRCFPHHTLPPAHQPPSLPFYYSLLKTLPYVHVHVNVVRAWGVP